MRRWLAAVFLCMIVLAASNGHAGQTGRGFTFGTRDVSGVGAVALSYERPRARPSSDPPQSSAGYVSYEKGPVLVPLVGQVLCGHDPTVPGGLTCVLPPPERPEIANVRRPRRPPSPDEVARRLADRAISLAPQPRLRLAPGRRGLTGLPSFFWLAERPRPIEARAGIGPLTVTAQARPVQFIWDFGDGSDLVTRGSGRGWTKARPGNIKHTYEGKDRYTVGVEVVWEARWRLGRGAWRSLGYFSNSDTRPYRVRSLISVLVKPR